MPTPEERLYKPDKINRWFAVSSILMTASIIWMIVVDYDRPWRDFQARYFVGKAALAHLDYLEATTQERKNEIAEAERGLRDAQELHATTQGVKQERLAAELAEADLEFRKVGSRWSAAFQVLGVTRDGYERVLAAEGPDHPTTKDALARVEEQAAEVAELRKATERHEDRKKQLEKELKELNKEVRYAQKRFEDLQQVAASALQKDQSYRGVLTDEGLLGGLPIVGAVINAPLADFAAPKNTPGHEEVKQVVLPGVRQRLNYLESYTTDRCTTCHIASDDPDFSKDKLARQLEEALPAINEELLRMKLAPLDVPPPPSVAGSANSPLPAGQVTKYWDELKPAQQDDYYQKLLGQVNTYLKLSDRKTIRLEEPVLAHPHRSLYVSADSPHPMSKMGCSVCHEGNPQETDFVQAAHMPPTHEVEEAWAEEYYVRTMGIPNITFDTIAHFWDRPMRLGKYSEAGCAKCHSEITDIARFEGRRVGERINLGRHLFTSVGCVNCHEDKALAGSRRVGPDLTHVASKLTPEFVQQWVFFPQKFRPSTRMPHFFMQENNGPGSENSFDAEPVLRTETEVAAITKYLMAVSKPWKPHTVPKEVTGDAARGKALFKQVGCVGCHSNLAEFGEDWITKDLVHRTSIDEQTARYQAKGMTHEQRARYAMEHFAGEIDTYLSPDPLRYDPQKPYNRPTFSRFAPELSGIGSKVTADWLYSWLMEPTHYSPETKMPSLRLTPGEAADIAAYLMTLRNGAFVPKAFATDEPHKTMADELIMTLLTAQRSQRHSRAILNDEGGELTAMLVSLTKSSLSEQEAYDLVQSMGLQEKKQMFLGNKMIAHYGCYACHTIRGFEKTTAPGTELSLWAEKPVTQLDFAFYDHAFHDMRHEKEEVYGHVYPPNAEALNYWSPGENPKEQITHTHAAFARHKMLNPRIWDREKIKRPYDKLKMPNFYFTDEEAEALTTYLLSRVPPRVADELKVDYGDLEGSIARGRQLTRELNCVGCHQIEDNAPTIQQYFRRTAGGKEFFDALNAPPLLWGEGAKVQHSWLHRFLKDVETLRPWLAVRMPSFQLTNQEAANLVNYFAALSRQDAEDLAESLGPIAEYREVAKTQTTKSTNGDPRPPGADWYEQPLLQDAAAALRRFAAERKLIREFELQRAGATPERVAEAHKKVLDRAEFMKKLYDISYPFVEQPPKPHSKERMERGSRFFNSMGCLQCHVLGEMLPGPAATTDDFIQAYRLDGVRGEGAEAVAMLNGVPYRIGSVIDGHTLISASNKYYENGDMETKAVVEGPKKEGGTERIVLVSPSAPNLSLAHQRLRRDWVYHFMLEPGWIQPGTKMPQNFPDGKSPFEGHADYPGAGADHINLLVDFLYHAGYVNARAPLVKSVAAPPKPFEEDGEAPKEFEEE